MKLNKPLLVIISLSMLLLIVIFPHICIDSASYALSLWFSIVIPSLLPFFIGASILSQTGVIRLLGAFFEPVTRLLFKLPGESAYVFIASAISGYPMGAKLCGELYQQNKMDMETAQRTVCFTSVGGPLFILGTVAYSLLNFSPAGIYIAFSHYLGAIFSGLLLSLFFNKKKPEKKSFLGEIKKACRNFAKEKQNTLGEILEYAVTNAISTILLIGGMMVLFNVMIGFMQKTGLIGSLSKLLGLIRIPQDISRPVLSGLVEMTAGCQQAALSNTIMAIKIPVIAFIISFGGFSVHAQTYAIATKAGLTLKFFLGAKIIQAFASFVLAYLLILLFPLAQAAFHTEAARLNETPALIYAGTLFALFSMAVLFLSLWIKKKSA